MTHPVELDLPPSVKNVPLFSEAVSDALYTPGRLVESTCVMDGADGVKSVPSRTPRNVMFEASPDLQEKAPAPEKHKVKFKHTIDPGQTAMEFLGKEIREGRMSVEYGGVKVENVAS
ncbi:MAG: hypothetical protein BWX99_03012 [Deltaproteobacteria bacterium ADurb.Bin151]|nr:MAG: hypothetical protein BWX99_03012 [Deltaproteobacteria bacterium ADurb.Bin151]